MDSTSSLKKVIEKVEILDESTGQIILKERTRIVDNESNQIKSDEDDELHDIATDSDEIHICSINYPHPTIISKEKIPLLEPIEVSSPDGKGSFYRCPLCSLTNAYYNVQPSKVVDHLNGNKHFAVAVKHHNWFICKCDESLYKCDPIAAATQLQQTSNGNSSGSSTNGNTSSTSNVHRHCPHCGKIFFKRNEFIGHLERCCPLQNKLVKHEHANSSPKHTNQQSDNLQNLIQQIHEQNLNKQQQQNGQTYVYVINTNEHQSNEQQYIPTTTGTNNRQQLKRKLNDDHEDVLNHRNTSSKQNKHQISSATTASYFDEANNHQTIILSNNKDPNAAPSTSTSHTNGLSPHIVQNYSILAHEITSPLDNDLDAKCVGLGGGSSTSSSSNNWNPKPVAFQSPQTKHNTNRAQKDMATCQFCGRAMLKKNIPTHIRRAHTPKEELVCLNEEQNIFTFQHLKPGQRRKRSARAYDYSLMTATISIDEDPCEGIENKFITEGEEILSTDLLQLADRIKFGISQIPTSTLTKLIDILTKIEFSTTDEICANAKQIKNMIVFYLTAGEEFKYKIKQIGDDISDKKKQVHGLRGDLKEIMARKTQLERRIQPIVCELQKLEDQHGNLIDTMMQLNGLIQLEIVHEDQDEGEDECGDEDENTATLAC